MDNVPGQDQPEPSAQADVPAKPMPAKQDASAKPDASPKTADSARKSEAQAKPQPNVKPQEKAKPKAEAQSEAAGKPAELKSLAEVMKFDLKIRKRPRF